MYQGHAERYGRQAHNLKVAGSNPAQPPQPKFSLPLIFDGHMTEAEFVSQRNTYPVTKYYLF